MGPRQIKRKQMNNTAQSITANGQTIDVHLPLTLHSFLVNQGMLPRSVVVELNGEAVSPSDFEKRELNAGDSMEIVNIVAGG